MDIRFLPATKLGFWSCLLVLGTFLFALLGVVIQESSRFPAIVAWCFGLGGAVAGGISFSKSKERAVLVAVATVLGIAVVVLGLIPSG